VIGIVDVSDEKVESGRNRCLAGPNSFADIAKKMGEGDL
jgi:hypothetical protein